MKPIKYIIYDLGINAEINSHTSGNVIIHENDIVFNDIMINIKDNIWLDLNRYILDYTYRKPEVQNESKGSE